jgi:hypothetical protein
VRYLLSILLSVLLPHQSVWAAAAVYDEHGPHHAAHHFAHHDGFHHATATDAPDEGVPDEGVSVEHHPTTTFDAENGHGHGHLAAAIGSMPIMPTVSVASPSRPRTQADWLSHSLSPPERPQWVRHA